MPQKSVQALLEDIRLLGEVQHDTVQAVRALFKRLVKPLSEEVKYGGIVFSSGVHFAGVFAYRGHVSVEFGHGSAIQDTAGHLQGEGKFRRHLKLAAVADIDAMCLADYIPLALKAAQDAA